MSLWLLGEDLAILRPIWLIVAAGLLVLALTMKTRRRHDGWLRVLSPGVHAFLGGDNQSGRARRIEPGLLIASLIAVAIAAPATRQSDNDTWRQSVGWIALVDVSRSMTLDDVVPSRLSAARQTLLSLSAAAGARPMALILFAGDAFLLAPPAFDRALLDEQAALLDYGLIPVDGSNLSRALSLATDVAESSDFAHARLFVLGDSGGIGNDSRAAVRLIADRGHRVDVLLYGSHGEADATLVQQDKDSSDADAATREDNTALVEDISQIATAGTSGGVDTAAARQLARAGNGVLLQSDPFGVMDLDELKLEHNTEPESVAELRSIVWRDQSHWILLLTLPALLRLFSRY